MPFSRQQFRCEASSLRRSSSTSRLRSLQLESLEERAVLAAATVYYEFADTAAPTTPLSTLQVNRDYLLRVLVQDTRGGNEATGIAQGYFDINYDAALLTVTNSFTHPDPYSVRPLGDATTDGLIDAAGGSTATTQGSSKLLLFTLPFRTDAVGTLTLNTTVDQSPDNAVRFFAASDAVTDIEYVGASIPIVAPTPGITVTPVSGLTTTEAGGTATFTIVLDSQPTNNVTIAISSSNTAEGTVSPTSVVFIPRAWNVPRTITVTGVDDNIADGNVSYSIVTAPATSADPDYNGRNAPDVSVTNSDDDTAGVVVTPTTGLLTTEAGGTATFTLRLSSQPTANVTIGLTSSNMLEGTVQPASVTFTPENWSAPQTATVTGVDDTIADGNVAYSIITSAAISTDPGYNGREVPDVSLINQDNDAAGVTVTPITGLVTTEAGGTATFTIRLNAQPTSNVTFGLTSSNVVEGTVSPASVVFTAANWNTAQTVTVTGVDDFIDDGDISYSIITAPANSADPAYDGFNPPDVSVANTDNDTAGIVVTPTTGLTTTEAGGTATFTIRLSSQPTANVTIGISSNNTAEGTVSAASAIFTAANWNTPQTITITGVDDAIDDGNANYAIITAPAVSSDPIYSGVNPADVAVVNEDNDDVGFSITPTSGLITTESGGTATFTVRLNSQPTANVTMGLTSNNPNEGIAAPATVTFTSANWNQPQTITVTGVDDSVSDGDVSYAIITSAASSADPKYSGLNPVNVGVTNQDNDPVAVSIVKTADASEVGPTAGSFSVRISQPVPVDTVVQYTVSGSATAGGDYTALSGTATIPANTTSVAIPVLVNDDNLLEGIETVVVTLTAVLTGDPDTVIDPVGNLATVNIADSETGRVQLAVTTNGSEAGPTPAVFTITQDGISTEDTVLTFSLTGTATAESDYTPPATTVTIPAGSTSVTVTIPIVNDTLVELEETLVATIALAGGDGRLNLSPADSTATATIADNDSATVSVAGVTQGNEAGPVAARFTITQSAASSVDTTVEYTLSGTATSGSDYTAPSGSVVIPAGQTSVDVVIPILDDEIVEPIETIILTLDSITGAQLVTISEMGKSASLEVLDNDNATVSIVAGDNGDEAGPVNGTFVVSMTEASSTDTVIAYTVGGTATSGTDYTALTGSVTIPAGETTATITVNVIDDMRFEGVETVSLQLTNITGNTAITLDAAADDATININDNETGVISIAATTPGNEAGPVAGRFTVTQAGSTDTDTVLTYTIAGTATAGTDYTALSGTVTIPAGQTTAFIDVAVLDDELVEGTETVSITLTAIQSGETGLTLSSTENAATLDILDNDTATLSIEKTADASEAGPVAGSFTIRLSKAAAVDTVVAVAYTGTATSGDYETVPMTVTIPAGQLSAVVTITPVDDNLVEGTETVIATLTGLTSASDGVTIPSATSSATLEIADNDTSTINLAAGVQPEEGGATGTFVITLANPSATPTTIAYTVAGTATPGADYTALSGSVTIPAGETTANIAIAAVDDNIVEGNESVALTLTSITAGSPLVTLGNALTATLQIADNDTATVAFVTATSEVHEVTGSQTVRVVLNIPGGGTLAKALTVNVSVAGGTAGAEDFTLTTTSVTFAAGTQSGATRNVNLTIVDDDVVEATPETVILALAIGTDGSGGQASLGTPNRHTVSITDDNFNGTLSGRVWLDADGNGVRAANELAIPNVTVRLTGTDRTGASVSRTAVTNSAGIYTIRNLAGGTYTLEQIQPTALINGSSYRGTIGNGAAGTVGTNRISNIVLPVSGRGTEFNFSELGLQTQHVTARSFAVAVLTSSEVLGNLVRSTQARTTAATTTTTTTTTTASAVSASAASTLATTSAASTAASSSTVSTSRVRLARTLVANQTLANIDAAPAEEVASVGSTDEPVDVGSTEAVEFIPVVQTSIPRAAAKRTVATSTPQETTNTPSSEVQTYPAEDLWLPPGISTPSGESAAIEFTDAVETETPVKAATVRSAPKRIAVVTTPEVTTSITEPNTQAFPGEVFWSLPAESTPSGELLTIDVIESAEVERSVASEQASEPRDMTEEDLLSLFLGGNQPEEDSANVNTSSVVEVVVISNPTAPTLAVDQIMAHQDWDAEDLL